MEYGIYQTHFINVMRKIAGEQVNYACRFFHFSFNITFKKKNTEISVTGQHPFSF